MDDRWFERLLEAVAADGRDMKTLSRDAGLGQNHVQQMVKNQKKPRVDTLVKLLAALGRADTMYIITGRRFSPADDELLEIAADLDASGKQKLIEVFGALKDASRRPGP